MSKIMDLHTHSSASDGQYSPKELVRLAKERGIQMLALTDHDTVSGIREAREAAQCEEILFVPGIEISTRKGVEIHILGLGIDESRTELEAVCRDYRNRRLERAKRICRYLKNQGVEITLAEVEEEAGGGPIGRPHFASVLVKRGYVKTKNDAFRKYLETYHFHQETDSVLPTPEEAIALIHKCEGKAILAHPGLLKLGRSGQEALIMELIGAGLDGIEAIYSGHEYAQKKYYENLAKEKHLMVTAGSDFHGEKVKPSVKLGVRGFKNEVYYDVCCSTFGLSGVCLDSCEIHREEETF